MNTRNKVCALMTGAIVVLAGGIRFGFAQQLPVVPRFKLSDCNVALVEEVEVADAAGAEARGVGGLRRVSGPGGCRPFASKTASSVCFARSGSAATREKRGDSGSWLVSKSWTSIAGT